MSNESQPFLILQGMQQQAEAAGHVLPELATVDEGWSGLAFIAGGIHLATELTAISDVVDCGAITPVPRSQEWMRGITNIRGALYSVLDLALFFDKPKTTLDSERKFMVINDAELGCAILIERVLGLRRFDDGAEHKDISQVDDSVSSFIDRVYLQDDELWGVLDMAKLKASNKFTEVEAYN